MKIQKLLLCALLAGVLPSCARAQTLIEAEANPTAGDMKILEMPAASGGKAVSIARDWQPLFKAAPPADGEAFTIWARYSGGAILLKSSVGGAQKDLKWSYSKPESLKWVKVGRFSRAEIGEQLFIIRGGGGGQGPTLDAVVFASDENYQPEETKAGGAPSTPGAARSTPGGAGATGAGINEAAAVELGMADAPKGELFEAENFKANGQVSEAAGASGGKAVSSEQPWQPIFEAPVPAGDAFKIWVRHKNGPLSVKAKGEDGKVKDNWSFRRPQNWTWTDMGVFSRESLGEKLRIGRGGESTNPAPLIDAVVFSPDKVRPLPADKPDPNAAPQTLAASIDWSKTIGEVGPMIWGINEHEILHPEKAGDKKFQELLGSVGAPLIRIHQADLGDSWTNAKTRGWDIEKIKTGFRSSTGYGNAKVMLCIPWAPKWLSEKVVPADKEDEFAALCGKLVKIMRDDVKRPIDYWEITNELEGAYERAGKLDDLWRLYNKIAVAIKKENSNAKTGGPALTYAKAEWVEGFLKNCIANTDFISWHNYGTGDLFESNESLFERVNGNVSFHAHGVFNALKKHAPNRKLETFLTETNVKYTWDPYERRHQNAVGAIFMASLLRRMALDGATGVALWQERGQAYGTLIDDKNKTFPALNLYRWGPKYLVGKIAQSVSPDEKQLEIFAVTKSDGTKSVLLLNKSNHALVLPAPGVLLPGAKTMQAIDADGYNAKIAMPTEALSLPGYSLTLFTTAS